MGFASGFHRYVDTIEIESGHDWRRYRPRVLVIGPGKDTEDIDYWASRFGWECVESIGPGPAPCKFVTHTSELFGRGALEGVLRFDVVWAAHVLEHAWDVQDFLLGARNVLMPGGHFFVAVPPLKNEIVGGHVNLFNMGLLIYRLVLAGFDCRAGVFKAEGYNLFGHVREYGRHAVRLPGRYVGSELKHDKGDIETLAHLFPMPVTQGFDGRIESINWPEVLEG